ncbi:hypothetical protein Tco_1133711 [Tanacetum coccineum]
MIISLGCSRWKDVLNSEMNFLGFGPKYLINDSLGSFLCPIDLIRTNLESTILLYGLTPSFFLAMRGPCEESFILCVIVGDDKTLTQRDKDILQTTRLQCNLPQGGNYGHSKSTLFCLSVREHLTGNLPGLAFYSIPLGMNEILYVPISTAYLANFPEASGSANSTAETASFATASSAASGVTSVTLCLFAFVIFLRVVEERIMAFVFLGFALIPSDVTMYPKNLPSSTPNEHFLGFSFMFIAFKFSKVSAIVLKEILSFFAI